MLKFIIKDSNSSIVFQSDAVYNTRSDAEWAALNYYWDYCNSISATIDIV